MLRSEPMRTYKVYYYYVYYSITDAEHVRLTKIVVVPVSLSSSSTSPEYCIIQLHAIELYHMLWLRPHREARAHARFPRDTSATKRRHVSARNVRACSTMRTRIVAHASHVSD